MEYDYIVLKVIVIIVASISTEVNKLEGWHETDVNIAYTRSMNQAQGCRQDVSVPWI